MFKQFIILVSILISTIGLAFALPLTGQKVIYGGGGYDYLTITAAINDLNTNGVGTGGVVFLVVGTFYENPPAITASGTAANPVLFSRAEGWDSVLVPAGGTGTYGFKLSGADYITFDYIDINGPSTLNYGYWLEGITNNGPQHNTIRNCNISVPNTSSNNYGIYFKNDFLSYNQSSSNLFQNNTISSCYYGISLDVYGNGANACLDNTIQGNTLTNIRGTAFYHRGGVNTLITGNNVSFTTESPYNLTLVEADGANSTITVSNNTFSGGSGLMNVSCFKHLNGQSLFENNTVNNINNNNYTWTGFLGNNGNADFSHNTISNITCSAICFFYGARLIQGSHIMRDNEISGVTNYGDLIGIKIEEGTTHYIKNNKIHGLHYIGGANHPLVRGMEINGITDNYIINNMIYDLTSSQISPIHVTGVYITNLGINHIWNNTIYLNASGTSSQYTTALINIIFDDAVIDLQNNILVNKSIAGINGLNYVIKSSVEGFSYFSPQTDHNIYYAGTPNPWNWLVCFGSAAYQTLAAYQAATATMDQNSFTENVPFVSSTGVINPHINPAVPTVVEGNAQTIAEVSTDIDGDTRDLSTPDIGADEGDFTVYVEPPGVPVYLSPANGAVNVPLITSLNWAQAVSGGIPTGYEVYFGMSNPPPFVYLTDALVHSLELNYGTTYYWKIIAVNGGGSAAGPVWSFSTPVDIRITSLPHTQNFDSVNIPALPAGWSSIVTSSAPDAMVHTWTSHSTTSPNSVYFYNSSDASASLYLVSPQITVGINNIRISFWARWLNSQSYLSVGTMSDPTDASTFTPLTEFPLESFFEKYYQGFTESGTTDEYLAFKMVSTADYSFLTLDTIILEQMPPIDLQAKADWMSSFGIPGMNNNYHLIVNNLGQTMNTTYTVRLLIQSGTSTTVMDTETFSGWIYENGVNTFYLSWTPAVSGVYYLHCDVIIAGDANTSDNTTPVRQINVYDMTLYAPLVGSTQTTLTENFLPIGFYARNSLTETIYTATEMQMTAGNILGIAFDTNFADQLIEKQVKVWMKNTTANSLLSGWLPFSGYALVFDGLVDIDRNENVAHIPLNTPFAYTGGNLAVRINRPMDIQNFGVNNFFIYSNPQHGPDRSRYLGSDTITYDPANPSAPGYITNTIPNTIFLVLDAVPVVLSPPELSFISDPSALEISWSEVPGAYAYKVYISDDPYSWNPDPDAIIYNNVYATDPTDTKKFYRIIAISTFE